jgi:hypothetical protein
MSNDAGTNPQRFYTKYQNFNKLYLLAYSITDVPCTNGFPNNPVYGLQIEGLNMSPTSNLNTCCFPLQMTGLFTCVKFESPILIAENGTIKGDANLVLTNGISGGANSTFGSSYFWFLIE